MTIVIPHHSTKEAVIRKVDETSDKLLAIDIKNVQIVDQTKSWAGPVMRFSFTAKLGYIALPLTGTLTVDDMNMTLDCELPPLVKNLVGEDKVRAMMEKNIRALVS